MLRYWSDTFHPLTRNILRVASVSEHRPHGRLITPFIKNTSRYNCDSSTTHWLAEGSRFM